MKIIARNKKINFNYETIETFKAGLVLEGWMVKSIRAGKVSLSDGSYIKIINNIPILMGLNIKALEQKNTFTKKDEQPSIKLLLNKKEINKLIGGVSREGMTIVLREIFFERHLVKANICLVKGKNNYDKRQDIKEKDSKREIYKAIKSKFI